MDLGFLASIYLRESDASTLSGNSLVRKTTSAIISWLNGQTQLELFIRYSILAFVSPYIFGFDMFLPREGFTNHLDIFIKKISWGSTLADTLHKNAALYQHSIFIPSCVLMFFPKTRRIGAGLFFLFNLWLSIFDGAYLSVLTDFLLIFALGLILFPADPQRLRPFFIGAFAAAFFCSAAQKANSFYFSGIEVQRDLRRLARSIADPLFLNPVYAQVLAVVGFFSELVITLIAAWSGPLQIAGFFALQFFIAGTFFHINLSHSLFKFFIGFPFLLEFPWARGRLFIVLIFAPFIFEILQKLEAVFFSNSPDLVQPILLFSFLAYCLFFVVLFAILMLRKGIATTPVPVRFRPILFAAFACCVLYASAARIFHWPNPYGWTQYSGSNRDKILYVAYLSDSTLLHRMPATNLYYVRRMAFNSWRDMVIEAGGNYAVASEDASRLNYFLNEVCSDSGKQFYYTEEQITRREFLEQWNDSDRIKNKINSGHQLAGCPKET
jgi:hypothetical protein